MESAGRGTAALAGAALGWWQAVGARGPAEGARARGGPAPRARALGAPAPGAPAAAACCTAEAARSRGGRERAAPAHAGRAAAAPAPQSGTPRLLHSSLSPSARHCSHYNWAAHPAPALCSHWTRSVGSARPGRAPRPSPTCAAGRAPVLAAASRGGE